MTPTVVRDTTTPCERLVYWGLVGLLFWAPLPFGSNRPWATAMIVIWVAVLGLVWSVGWAFGKCSVHSSFYRGRVALVLLAAWAALISAQTIDLPLHSLGWLSPGAASVFGERYAGAMASSATLSIHPAATGRYQLLTLALVGYFALMLLVIQRTHRLKHFALMLTLSGSLYAVLALYLHFTGANYLLFHEGVAHEVTKGPFMNRNHFAAYIELCLAVGVGLIVAELEPSPLSTWKQRARWMLQVLLSSKMRVRLLLVVMVIALILTRSRMGNAAFLSALLVGGLAALACMRAGWKVILVFIGSMIMLDVLVIGSWIGVEQVMKRVQQTAIASDTKHAQGLVEQSLEERTEQGFSALPSLKAFGILGVGGGGFEALYPQYKRPGYTMSLDHAHVDYVEFLVESGWVGMSLLTAFAIICLARAGLVMARSGYGIRRGLALGALIGLFSTMIHASVEFALQIPAVAFVLVATCGICCLSKQKLSKQR